ncbi:hypothetical protein A4A36_17285 [Bacillus subtilis]|uniref:HNH endonuclease n=1 Tax=Bacillus stercoris TaxID=2054641 RepID=UPI0008FAFB3B|nr:hypothetical protein A4A37_21355 [Bacillus subtilis]OIS65840.1 hypothetical protein A4A36_17285 [Bacillus subtilis]OIS73415.1 hypothetical protein A4A35_20225 [Bacillus subtilis]
MEKYKHFKLKIEAKPSIFHGKTVRKTIGQSLWYKIRAQLLKRDTPQCSICGFIPESDETNKIHIHEQEEYDFENIVVKLIGLNLICANCHAFHHFGFTQIYSSKEKMQQLIEHFIKVNGCSINEFKEYKRSLSFKRLPTNLDLSPKNNTVNKLSLQDMLTGNYTVKFAIVGDIPLKSEVIEKLNKKGLYFENN